MAIKWNDTPIEDINRENLELTKIDSGDTLKNMIDKINQNFYNIAKHGGGPSGLDGTDGLDGVDGIDAGNVEYIYALSDSMISDIQYPESDSSKESLYTQVKTFGSYTYNGCCEWHDHPQGISEDHTTEYVMIRYERSGEWFYTAPVIWSRWGEKGQDGDGIEYIYNRNTSASKRKVVKRTDLTSEAQKVIYNIDGFIPHKDWFNSANKETAKTKILNANLMSETQFNSQWGVYFGFDTIVGSGFSDSVSWTDEPSGTTAKYPNEYVSIRRSTSQDSNGRIWESFTTPALWSHYGKDANDPFVYDLTNQSFSMGVGSDGIFNGESNVTTYVGVQAKFGTKDVKIENITASVIDSDNTNKITVAAADQNDTGGMIASDSLKVFKVTISKDNTVFTHTKQILFQFNLRYEYDSSEEEDLVQTGCVLKFNIVGLPEGEDGFVYELVPSAHLLVKKKSGNYIPSMLYCGKTANAAADKYVIRYSLGNQATSDLSTEYNNTSAYPSSGLSITNNFESGVTFFLFDTSNPLSYTCLDNEFIPMSIDGEDGTSPYVFNLTNDMYTVGVGSDFILNGITESITTSTQLKAYYGASQATISSLTATIDDPDATDDNTHTGRLSVALSDDHTLTVTIPNDTLFKTAKTIKLSFKLSYSGASDQLNNSISFHIIGNAAGKDGTVYEVIPNTNIVVKQKDGVTYKPSILTCEKSADASSVRYSLKYASGDITGNTEVGLLDYPTSGITMSSTYDGGISLCLYDINEQKVIDYEYIPVVKDGEDGESTFGYDLTNEMYTIGVGTDQILNLSADKVITTQLKGFYGANEANIGNVQFSYNDEDSNATGLISAEVVDESLSTTVKTINITLKDGIKFYHSKQIEMNFDLSYGSGSNQKTNQGTVTFTISGLQEGKDGIAYEILPGASAIKKNKDGGYYPSSISCAKDTCIADNTDYVIKYKHDGINSIQTYSTSIPVEDSFGEGITFYLFKSTETDVTKYIDMEFVPIIEDGKNRFTAFAFTVTSWVVDLNDGADDYTVTGGSSTNPVPDTKKKYNSIDIVWSSAPGEVGEGQIIWMTTASFVYGATEPEDGWTTPRKMADSTNINVEWCKTELTDAQYNTVKEAITSDSFNYGTYLKAADGNEDNAETAFRNAMSELSGNPEFTDDASGAIYMAMTTYSNGYWSNWEFVKVKGEKGDTGTSLEIKGSINYEKYYSDEGSTVTDKANLENYTITNSKSVLTALASGASNGNFGVVYWEKKSVTDNSAYVNETTDANNGIHVFIYKEPTSEWVYANILNCSSVDGIALTAGYTLMSTNGHMIIWDGDSWFDAGKIKGDDGLSTFIKYANKDDSSSTTISVDGESIKVNEASTPAEAEYIGFAVAKEMPTSITDSAWNWSVFKGQDGFGYEYIFLATSDKVAPDIPSKTNAYYTTNPTEWTIESAKFDFCPYVSDGSKKWSDEPIEPSSDNRYIWMCYRTFENGAWCDEFKGTSDNKAKLWNSYVNSITSTNEYYFASASINTSDLPYTDDNHQQPILTGSGNKWVSFTDAKESWNLNKKYLWNIEKIEYTADGVVYSEPQIIAVYAEGISSIEEYYCLGTSAEDAPAWGTDEPKTSGTSDAVAGKDYWTTDGSEVELNKDYSYLWNIEHIIYEDTTKNTWTSPVVIGVYNEAKDAYTVDLSNEMETINVIGGKVQADVNIETIIGLWVGNEQQTMTKSYISGVSGESAIGVSNGAIKDSAVQIDEDGSEDEDGKYLKLSFTIAKDTVLSNFTNNIEITISYLGYNKIVTFKVLAIEGNCRYSINLSDSYIHKNDKGVITNGIDSISVIKYKDGEHSIVTLSGGKSETEGLTLKYKINGGDEVLCAKSSIAISDITTNDDIKFNLYWKKDSADILIDTETVPVIKDGEDGTSLTIKDVATYELYYTSYNNPGTYSWDNSASILANNTLTPSPSAKNIAILFPEEPEDNTGLKDITVFVYKDNAWVKLNTENTSTDKTGLEDEITSGYSIMTPITGHMVVWDGDSWVDAGKIKGETGENGNSIWIKYAEVDEEGTTVSKGYSGKLLETSPEEADYVGFYVGQTISTDLDEYTWNKFKGEDGFGYEYIYLATSNFIAPSVPTSSNCSNWPSSYESTDEYLPTFNSTEANYSGKTWSDDPMSVSETNKYVWMVWRKREGSIWTPFKGDAEDTEKAKLWNSYVNSITSTGEYYLASSNNTNPSYYNTTTYKPNTSYWVTSTSLAGWDATNKYLWNIEQINYTVDGATYTPPQMIAVYANGITGVSEYYCLDSDGNDAPKMSNGAPIISSSGSEGVDYWTTKPSLTVVNSTNKYLWNIERILYEDSTKDEWTNPTVIGVYSEGQNAVYADLDNEMDSIGTIDGKVIADQTFSTTVHLWDGNTKQALAITDVDIDGEEDICSEITDSSTSSNGSYKESVESGYGVKIYFKINANTSISSAKSITITVKDSKIVTYKVIPLEGDHRFSLVLSDNNIAKDAYGNLKNSSALTVKVLEYKNGTHSYCNIPTSSSDTSCSVSLSYSINGGDNVSLYSTTGDKTTATISTNYLKSVSSKLQIQLTWNEVVVDMETLGVTQDGSNGDAGENVFTADLTNEIWSFGVGSNNILDKQMSTTTAVSAWYGSAAAAVSFASGNAWYSADSGISLSKSGNNITVTAASNVSYDSPKQVSISFTATSDSKSAVMKKTFNIVGIPGGEDGQVFELLPGATAVKKSTDETYTPSYLTCDKTSDASACSIYYKAGEDNRALSSITSATGLSSYASITMSSDFDSGVTFYLFNGSQCLDKEYIPVITDGTKGDTGDSAFTVDLTNDMYSFAVGNDKIYNGSTFYIPTVHISAWYGGNVATVSASYTKHGSDITVWSSSSDWAQIAVAPGADFTSPKYVDFNYTATYGSASVSGTKIFYIVGIPEGADGQVFELLPGATAIHKEYASNSYTPSYLTCDKTSDATACSIYYKAGEDNSALSSITTTSKSQLTSTSIRMTSTYNGGITFYLFNSSGSCLDKEYIPVIVDGAPGTSGSQGAQGIQGAIVRGPVEFDSSVSRWYYDGTTESNGLYYLDVVENTGKYYQCVSTYNQGLKSSVTTASTSYWKEADNTYEFIATNLLLAEDAKINFMTGNEIYMTDESGNLAAGVTGVSTSEGVNFFAGLGEQGYTATSSDIDLKDANFYVTNSGFMHANTGEFNGNINAEEFNVVNDDKLPAITFKIWDDEDSSKYASASLSIAVGTPVFIATTYDADNNIKEQYVMDMTKMYTNPSSSSYVWRNNLLAVSMSIYNTTSQFKGITTANSLINNLNYNDTLLMCSDSLLRVNYTTAESFNGVGIKNPNTLSNNTTFYQYISNGAYANCIVAVDNGYQIPVYTIVSGLHKATNFYYLIPKISVTNYSITINQSNYVFATTASSVSQAAYMLTTSDLSSPTNLNNSTYKESLKFIYASAPGTQLITATSTSGCPTFSSAYCFISVSSGWRP